MKNKLISEFKIIYNFDSKTIDILFYGVILFYSASNM